MDGGVEVVPMVGTTFLDTSDKIELRSSYASLLSNKLAELTNGISLICSLLSIQVELKTCCLEGSIFNCTRYGSYDCQQFYEIR
ncbi:MAG: hypothetical protein ACI4PU_07470 [Intestinibacter sp.]